MITKEIAAFFEAGNSIHIAARDGDLAPSGARAWAVTVAHDRTHLTVFVLTAAARRMLVDLEKYPELAVSFSRVDDHVAWQVKGTCVEIRPARPSEREAVTRQAETFREHIAAIGIAKELTAGWRYWPCIAVRMKVSEIFNQTPGPGAGARVP